MHAHRTIRFGVVATLISGLVAFAASCGKNSSTRAERVSTPTAEVAQAQRMEPGQQAYLAYCAMCHGDRGDADGPLADELEKYGGVRPAHLNDGARLSQLGRREVVRVIERGGAHTGRSNLMPPWGEKLEPAVVGRIADFVMRLPDLVPRSTLEKYMRAPPGSAPAGRRLFVYYCTMCHGAYGRGDGYIADTLFARNGIRPRNLTDSVYFAGRTDRELYVTIALGGGHVGKSVYMPAWSVTLSPEQIKDLLSYVRAISHTASRP